MGLICGHFCDSRLYEQRPTVFLFEVICKAPLEFLISSRFQDVRVSSELSVTVVTQSTVAVIGRSPALWQPPDSVVR